MEGRHSRTHTHEGGREGGRGGHVLERNVELFAGLLNDWGQGAKDAVGKARDKVVLNLTVESDWRERGKGGRRSGVGNSECGEVGRYECIVTDSMTRTRSRGREEEGREGGQGGREGGREGGRTGDEAPEDGALAEIGGCFHLCLSPGADRVVIFLVMGLHAGGEGGRVYSGGEYVRAGVGVRGKEGGRLGRRKKKRKPMVVW
jgi:hypothetical protein